MAASRPLNPRVAVAAALGLAATGLIAFAALRDGNQAEEIAAASPPAPAAVPALPEATPPALDLVRVEPDGAATLAGRAAPGALVAVRAGETVLATAEADASGAFVATFDAAPDGPRDLVLATETAPEAALALTLPEPEGGFAPAVPLPEPAAEPAAETIAAPEAAPATPGAAPVEVAAATPAPAPAVPESAVPLSAPQPATPEAPQAGIAQSAPLPRPTARPAGAGAATVVVQPGGTLWTLARDHYGAGRRYPVIVSANAGEIADPALIFPGQRLVLPPVRSD